MFFQILRSGGTQLTNIIIIWLPSVVNILMFFQIMRLREALLRNITFIWLLAGMNIFALSVAVIGGMASFKYYIHMASLL
jgi:hypothetical protein